MEWPTEPGGFRMLSIYRGEFRTAGGSGADVQGYRLWAGARPHRRASGCQGSSRPPPRTGHGTCRTTCSHNVLARRFARDLVSGLWISGFEGNSWLQGFLEEL